MLAAQRAPESRYPPMSIQLNCHSRTRWDERLGIIRKYKNITTTVVLKYDNLGNVIDRPQYVAVFAAPTRNEVSAAVVIVCNTRGLNVQRNPSCLRTTINKGYKAARFGARTAGGADARRQQWMPDRFFERSISITTETIFLQLKSIWCEMFQHSAAETNLVHRNHFRCDRNDFPAVEIDLVRNVSTFCGRIKSGTPERF